MIDCAVVYYAITIVAPNVVSSTVQPYNFSSRRNLEIVGYSARAVDGVTNLLVPCNFLCNFSELSNARINSALIIAQPLTGLRIWNPTGEYIELEFPIREINGINVNYAAVLHSVPVNNVAVEFSVIFKYT